MFSVTPISAFSDNYIWVISLPDTSRVAVVDPGDAEPVEAYLTENNLELCAILITHHHNDHTGGVKALVDGKRNIPVYGPDSSPFKGITNPLHEGDRIELLGTTLSVKTIPGHTLDHICYFVDQPNPQLFCGDTLFLAGCGRLFEGTAKQMLTAMHYFSELPDTTEVYCTHEYSLANLSFAAAVEPENQAIQDAISRCKKQREQGKPTLPTSIAQEKEINPFMRTTHRDVISAAHAFSHTTIDNEVEVFAAIREWKNQF
ncbi:MAG: hydroxyacylglutathione hydrolase [Neptuniibacter caesariensis]|uniref:Hydroxyacylglutathione hydrolase n=1 Tax=Neptuniibacter caesariensis TaxID=207954 RepID=A0A2G6JQ67_NEPCE|nr:MAG: hydroxyacylglutathione hydrolase [Neptuniibacter caesariensis]